MWQGFVALPGETGSRRQVEVYAVGAFFIIDELSIDPGFQTKEHIFPLGDYARAVTAT